MKFLHSIKLLNYSEIVISSYFKIQLPIATFAYKKYFCEQLIISINITDVYKISCLIFNVKCHQRAFLKSYYCGQSYICNYFKKIACFHFLW